jgi:nitrogen fixation NifU-like protein
MSELDNLYQELIVDHSKHPRNFGKLEPHDHEATGYNPLCGDKVTVFLQMENGVVKAVQFQGVGCAISTASASLMTERLLGKSQVDAEKLFEQFHNLVTKGQVSESADAELGKLKAFSGLTEFPMRVKCATLAWHTFRAAMRNEEPEISVE